jgi:hypothetical protein
MNSNIVIILYLLFLLVICSNKPVLVEGAMFSSSNCSNVQGILNHISTGHTNCVNDPTIGINCNILSGLQDLVQNEYNEVCNPTEGGLNDEDIINQEDEQNPDNTPSRV